MILKKNNNSCGQSIKWVPMRYYYLMKPDKIYITLFFLIAINIKKRPWQGLIIYF